MHHKLYTVIFYWLSSTAAAHMCSTEYLFHNQWQKIGEKLLFGQLFCFCPVDPLNNVETQWTQLTSSYVMGSQHGGERRFWNTFFKIPIIFSHWL